MKLDRPEDLSPAETKTLRARKKWLERRQELRFLRPRKQMGGFKKGEFERYGLEPDAPREHPGTELRKSKKGLTYVTARKFHYPRSFGAD